MVGFSSLPILCNETRGNPTQGGTRVIDHPTRRKTQGVGIVKGWEDKRDRGSISDTLK